MVRRQQHVGAQRAGAACDQRCASCGRFDVAGQQDRHARPLSMRSTQLRAFGFRRGVGVAGRRSDAASSKRTPSQSQCWPAAQRRWRRAARTTGCAVAAARTPASRPRSSPSSDSAPPLWSASLWLIDHAVQRADAAHAQVRQDHAAAGVRCRARSRARCRTAGGGRAVSTSSAMPWPTSKAVTRNAAGAGRVRRLQPAAAARPTAPAQRTRPAARRQQPQRAGQRAARTPRLRRRRAPHRGRPGRQPRQQRAPAAPTAACASTSSQPHRGSGSRLPASASGVTTKLTSGIATALASGLTSDTWANSSMRQRHQAEPSPPTACAPAASSAAAPARARRRARCGHWPRDTGSPPPRRTTARSPATARPTGRAARTTPAPRTARATTPAARPLHSASATTDSMYSVRWAGTPKPASST